MENLTKSVILDGASATEALDTSGEQLIIEGHDISDLENGLGVLNWEHSNNSPNDTVGQIIYAKKIFSEKDCKNDREKMYWNEIGLPFVYIKGELFDDEDHPGAKALASMVRYYHKRKLPLVPRFSVEGSTLEREGNVLKRTIARRVSVTLKPCNRSAISGVFSDSNEKEESKDILSNLKRYENPEFETLGKYESKINPLFQDRVSELEDSLAYLKEISELNKAIAAGGYDASPSTLSGGSALMAEEVTGTVPDKKKLRTWKNSALAAYRDFRGSPSGKFKDFLKSKLPEVSDSFINYFSDMVDDLRLKKEEELQQNLLKAFGSTAQKIEDPEKEANIKPTLSLTVRGMKRRPVNVPEPVLDEKHGALITPLGSLKLYNPSEDKTVIDDSGKTAADSFHEIINSPKITKLHDEASSNWLKMHNALKEGKLPSEVVMHASLFSMLSPNTPVPVQELMYAHLVDTMNEKGIDATSGKFPSLKETWINKDKPSSVPQTARSYFEEDIKPAVTIKGKISNTGRKQGEMQPFQLANDKFENMARYHKFHDAMVDLVNRNGIDMRSGAKEIMAHKVAGSNWEERRKRNLENGHPDIGPYTSGPIVGGLAPKTSRYMLGMLGAGNGIVPDTHFVRYIFGLEHGKDSKTIDYVKNVLWNERNNHILEGIDRWFIQHHPSVKHLSQEHPELSKHFKDNPDQSAFLAFWKTWLGIAEHETARGMNKKGKASNVNTTHKPWWDVTLPYLKSEEDLPLRTAMLHHKWVEDFGEIPAQILYFKYIVPQLMSAANRRENLDKSEDLNKAAGDVGKLPNLQKLPDVKPPEGSTKFKGKHTMPGEIEITSGTFAGSKLPYLGEDKHNKFVMNGENLESLPHHQEGKGFKVNKPYSHTETPVFVDATKHSHDRLNMSPHQHDLIHGINMVAPPNLGEHSHGLTQAQNPEKVGWVKSISGRHGYMKPAMTLYGMDPYEQDFSSAKRETVYHNLARDFFDLGNHVPNTATFSHPGTNEDMSVMEKLPNASHYYPKEHKPILNNLNNNGTLDRLGLMDMIMGNGDRHSGNFMVSEKAPFIHHIDNGLAFVADHMPQNRPDYIKYAKGNDESIHPAARSWLLELDENKMAQEMHRNGVPEELIQNSINRLDHLKKQALNPHFGWDSIMTTPMVNVSAQQTKK